MNAEIYRDAADDELVESVRQNGILQPILIDSRDRIISGHRRWDAAQKAGLSKVPVQVLSAADELQLVTALIESNRQRTKTNEQVAREAACLFGLERQRAEQRRAESRLKDKDPAKSPEQNGDARAMAAKKLGMGEKKVEQAAALVEAIDNLKKSDRKDEAEILRSELNRSSMNRAYRLALERGWLEVAQTGSRSEPPGILLATWQAKSPERRKELLQARAPSSPFARLASGAAEWARWSWDPVTGCSHGCEYCTARDFAKRRFRHGFQPVFYPGRLNAPVLTKLPPGEEAPTGPRRNVLTCWLADLFGDWVPSDIIEAVLEAIQAAPQWNFLLTTKNPGRLGEFRFPQNAWVGATVDSQKRVSATEKALAAIDARVKWLICEPLRTRLTFERLEVFQWIVIGGADRSSQTSEFRPPREWVQHLWSQADKAGCKVYEMGNLLECRREYPHGAAAGGASAPAA